MKRSEMFEIIADHVRDAIDLYAFNKEVKPDLFAHKILKAVEQKGMLPPYNPIGSEPQEGHVMYCQWEPEDE